MKNVALFLYLAVIFGGCKKDSDSNINAPIFSYENASQAEMELGQYFGLFAQTNASIKLEITEYDNGLNTGSIFGRFQEELTSPRSDGGDFYVDDLQLVHNSAFQQYTPIEGAVNANESYERIIDLFGKEVQVRIENDGENIEGAYYIPEKLVVEVDGLGGHPSTNASSIEITDTHISWNKDEKNEHGIVVQLSYDGTNIIDGTITSPSERIERAMIFSDTGSGIIQKEFFEDIPEGGVFTIYFIRGVVDILENPETKKTFKFYSLTKDKDNFVVI